MYLFIAIALLFYQHTIYAQEPNHCQTHLTPISSKQFPNRIGDAYLLSSTQQTITQSIQSATGDASLYSKDFALKADVITLNKAKNRLTAQDNVSLTDSKFYITTDRLNIEQIDTSPIVSLGLTNFQTQQTPLFGHAKSAIGTRGNYQLSQATFSTCADKDPVWQIKSEQLTLDTINNRGSVKNARFELMGVPLFYISEYHWILKGRASGFLTPKFSSYKTNNNRREYQLTQPYYFNLAADKDLTLSVNHFSDKGQGIDGHYRQLLQQGDIDIKTQYLPNDALNNKDRWHLKSNNSFQINKNLGIELSIDRVSDINFFTDIEHRFYPQRTLNSLLKYTYKEKDRLISASYDEQQLIQDHANYVRQPELLWQQHKELAFGYVDFLTSFTQFKHPDTTQISGSRSHAQLTYAKPFYKAAYTLKPEINLLTTQYNLEGADNQTRQLLNFNLDAQWHLLKNLKWLGVDAIQTLTPRIFYNYTQDKNQDNLPSFDSNLIDQHYDKLFTKNPYTGFDRVQAANNITLGLSSDIVSQKTGNQLLQTGIAQTFYGKKSYNPFNIERKRSNIIMFARIGQAKHNLDARLQYDPQTGKLVNQHHLWHYQKNNKTFITLGYQEDQQVDRYGEIYGAYQFSKNSRFLSAIQYDLKNNITNKSTYGIDYRNCCLAMRFNFNRNYSNLTNDYTNSISLSYDLTGFINQASPNVSSIDTYRPEEWFK